MPSSTNISWLVSYSDRAGVRHYLTSDMFPPNHGNPPPPGHEPPVLPLPAGFPVASSTSPPPDSQPGAVASYGFRPAQQTPVTSPTQFVNIHFINNGVRPHRDRFTGRNRNDEIEFTVCRAATNMKMKDLVGAFVGSEARGLTECKLLSDSYSWAEVRTFKLGDDNSEKTLKEVGWTESRGVDDAPVWVCAYHEGLDDAEEKRYWEGRGFVAS